jgi:hypothetical protein
MALNALSMVYYRPVAQYSPSMPLSLGMSSLDGYLKGKLNC